MRQTSDRLLARAVLMTLGWLNLAAAVMPAEPLRIIDFATATGLNDTHQHGYAGRWIVVPSNYGIITVNADTGAVIEQNTVANYFYPAPHHFKLDRYQSVMVMAVSPRWAVVNNDLFCASPPEPEPCYPVQVVAFGAGYPVYWGQVDTQMLGVPVIVGDYLWVQQNNGYARIHLPTLQIVGTGEPSTPPPERQPNIDGYTYRLSLRLPGYRYTRNDTQEPTMTPQPTEGASTYTPTGAPTSTATPGPCTPGAIRPVCPSCFQCWDGCEVKPCPEGERNTPIRSATLTDTPTQSPPAPTATPTNAPTWHADATATPTPRESFSPTPTAGRTSTPSVAPTSTPTPGRSPTPMPSKRGCAGGTTAAVLPAVAWILATRRRCA